MTDQEYDAYKAEIRKLAPDHPVLAKIGDIAASEWQKKKHITPMGSLSDIFTEEDFRKWAAKFPTGTRFTAQPKLDGLSIGLEYLNSDLESAITRGDGSEGEDITVNARKMKNCPQKLSRQKLSGAFRAEILLPKEDFESINSILTEDEQYANPRNAAAGICRRLDGKFCQYLMLLAYDHSGEDDEDKKLDTLKELGFQVPKQVIGDVEKMIWAYKEFTKRRESYPVWLDGVVIKVCSKEIQEEAGFVNRRPKAMVAWKFDPPGAITTLLRVTWDVGRTGVVTPLAWVEPVDIAGSKVQKATLHNVAEIARLGVKIGDKVMIVKAGDIIPKIIQVVEHTGGQEIKIPTRCPSCDSELKNDGVRLFCQAPLCPRKSLQRVMNWVKVTGIDEFGESLAEALWEKSLLKSISDLYMLKPEIIAGLEGWGKKSASTIIGNIQKSASMSHSKFLAAVGIPGISDKTASELVSHFGSVYKVLEATEDEIKTIRGFSDVSAKSVVTGLAAVRGEIEGLLKVVSLVQAETLSGGSLAGGSFCFTGKMAQPREYYQELVVKAGGKSASSVTKDLSFLVCNEDAGSTKSQKAKKFGVKIITEQEFLTMLGDVKPEEKKVEKSKTYSLF